MAWTGISFDGKRATLTPRVVLPIITLALAGLPAGAQEAEESGWANASELSFVQTGGNAESATLGLANSLAREWASTQLKIEFGGIRTSTTATTRLAVGTAGSFQLSEESDTDLSAAKYYGRVRFDKNVSDRSALFAQSGWLRNTFAGVDNRYVTVAGLSNQWIDTEVQKFGTAYGVTYTSQDDVVPNPAVSDAFVGAQVSADFWRQLTPNSEWTSRLVLDGNGDQTSDFRGDWINSLGVSMNENLALKTTLQLLFDNEPSLVSVPLQSPIGDPIGDVFVPLNEFDRVLTVALVISF